jgi:hypothetical protein
MSKFKPLISFALFIQIILLLSPGCTIKEGSYAFQDVEKVKNKSKLSTDNLDLEIYVYPYNSKYENWTSQHLTFSIGGGMLTNFGFNVEHMHTEGYYYDNNMFPSWADISKSTDIFNARVMAYYYPINKTEFLLRPFIGAGMRYYWMQNSISHYETYETSSTGGMLSGTTYYAIKEVTETENWGHGIYPKISTGIDFVPFRNIAGSGWTSFLEYFALRVEFWYDFYKKAQSYNLNTYGMYVGIGFVF